MSEGKSFGDWLLNAVAGSIVSYFVTGALGAAFTSVPTKAGDVDEDGSGIFVDEKLDFAQSGFVWSSEKVQANQDADAYAESDKQQAATDAPDSCVDAVADCVLKSGAFHAPDGRTKPLAPVVEVTY